MKRALKKLVFVEPKSTHLHVYSRVCIPRLGSVLLGTIMRAKGYDVRVYIEDFLVRGEGEFAFQELVDAIQRGDGFDRIQNLTYRTADGALAHNAERPKIPNLDVNPIPDYHLIEGWKPGGVISVATSRGCPFSCTFCSVPGMYGHAFRTHSIDRVLQELQSHKGNMYTFFADDIFTANKKRCKELLRGMITHDLTPQWGAQVRTETVDDPELLQMMRDSNCFNVYVGFESINPRTLKLFQKKQDLAKIERSIERFHAHKIRIHGMFVVGSDEDDLETLDATATFARKHDIDSIQFMILTPIPGSPDWDTLYAKGDKYVINKNWSFYDGHHCVHQPRRMSPYELQMGAIKAMEKFYSWGGIFQKLAKRDIYYAAIRYWGKKMLREWWKDEENKEYVEWLRGQLYGESAGASDLGLVRTVGVPALLLQEKIGQLLQRFLGELGVTVVPLAEAAMENASAAMENATAAARQTVDCVITPIVKRAEQGREDVYAKLASVTEGLQAQWERLPKVAFPLVDGQGPVFEPFAKIGLLVTRNLDAIRTAYKSAGVAEGLWEAA